jgi:hypothetical protein
LEAAGIVHAARGETVTACKAVRRGHGAVSTVALRTGRAAWSETGAEAVGGAAASEWPLGRWVALWAEAALPTECAESVVGFGPAPGAEGFASLGEAAGAEAAARGERVGIGFAADAGAEGVSVVAVVMGVVVAVMGAGVALEVAGGVIVAAEALREARTSLIVAIGELARALGAGAARGEALVIGAVAGACGGAAVAVGGIGAGAHGLCDGERGPAGEQACGGGEQSEALHMYVSFRRSLPA